MVDMRSPNAVATAVITNPEAYRDAGIPKVAGTPLEEGSNSFANQTFGPFNTSRNNNRKEDASTMISSASTKKTVRFEGFEQYAQDAAATDQPQQETEVEESHDPIEKAFDSIFLFYDDVREASSTLREDGTGTGCGERLAFECVTDGLLCRNLCDDACTDLSMSPPADLLLKVEDIHDDDDDDDDKVKAKEHQPVEDKNSKNDVNKESTASSKTTTENVVEEAVSTFKAVSADKVSVESAKKSVSFLLSKENSVKDFSDEPEPASEGVEETKEEEEEEEEVPPEKEFLIPECAEVDAIMDKLRMAAAQDILQQMIDKFAEQYGDAKTTDEESKEGDDIVGSGDPFVDTVDALILAYDDFSESLEEQKVIFLERKDVWIKQLEEAVTECGHAAATTAKCETVEYVTAEAIAGAFEKEAMEAAGKRSKGKKIKPASAAMPPNKYAEALESAAHILSENAPEEDLMKYSKEELHQRAVEKIMAEQDDSFSEGEYKTEEMLLRELMADAEQAILEARSMLSTDESEKSVQKFDEEPVEPEEQMIVLGRSHSATLTPIPEADEGSTGSPSSMSRFNVGIEKGTAPEVPLATLSIEEEPASSVSVPIMTEILETEAPEASVAATSELESEINLREDLGMSKSTEEPRQESPAQKKEEEDAEEAEEYTDPFLIKIIDNMFLCYDDIQEQKAAICCKSDPSDLDTSDDITMARDDTEHGRSTAEQLQADISSAPTKIAQDISEGQSMIEDALKMVQEAKKLAKQSNDEVRIAKSVDELAATETAATGDFMSQIHGLLSVRGDAEQRRIAEFVLQRHTKMEFDIPESVVNGQDSYAASAWGGDDSELMASINADRKLSEKEHVNIFRDVTKEPAGTVGGVTLYRAPAFSAGKSSSSAELGGTERDLTQAALESLLACSSDAGEQEQ